MLAPLVQKRGGKSSPCRYRCGLSSKIHTLSDGPGNPFTFALTTGQAGDAPEAEALFDNIPTQAVIADRTHDTDAISEAIDARGAGAVIPAKANRKVKRDTDWSLYKERHRIGLMFGFMKHYRRVFARFDKLARRFLSFVHFVAACILLR